MQSTAYFNRNIWSNTNNHTSETNWRLALLPVKTSVLVSDWEQGKIVQSWDESNPDALLHILWGHPLPCKLCKSAFDVSGDATVKIEKRLNQSYSSQQHKREKENNRGEERFLLTTVGVSGSVTLGTMWECGMARPFSRRAGWIMWGLRCGGLSCLKLSKTSQISQRFSTEKNWLWRFQRGARMWRCKFNGKYNLCPLNKFLMTVSYRVFNAGWTCRTILYLKNMAYLLTY